MCLIVSSCQLASEPHHGFGCRRFILNLNQFVHQNLGHSAITLNMYCLRLVDISCITFDWRLRRVEEVRILLLFEFFYVMRKDLLVQELIKLIKIYIQRLNGYHGCMRRASEWLGRRFYWYHDVNWAIFKLGAAEEGKVIYIRYFPFLGLKKEVIHHTRSWRRNIYRL